MELISGLEFFLNKLSQLFLYENINISLYKVYLNKVLYMILSILIICNLTFQTV